MQANTSAMSASFKNESGAPADTASSGAGDREDDARRRRRRWWVTLPALVLPLCASFFYTVLFPDNWAGRGVYIAI